MEADFSGYATRTGIKCSDGKVIMPNAFKLQHKARVPLVWQHGHNDPGNVLGHAVLENRPDGVYAYGYFNKSANAAIARESVRHGDITNLSIYANNLTKQGPNVQHGSIREVSLVFAGANPGAFIDNVYLSHSDGPDEIVESEAIIYNDQEIIHADAGTPPAQTQGVTVATDTDNEKTVQDVVDEMTEEQKNVLYFLVGSAAEDASEGFDEDDTVQQADFTEALMHYQEGILEMTKNVFENGANSAGNNAGSAEETLSHSQIKEIISDAERMGSLKDSILAHAQTYGIQNIDVLFPDAKNIASSPDVIGRRTEWVASVLSGATHSPFSRIKSTAVDITAEEARAKGYVKGNLKKEEIIKLLKRVTTPTTVYKKQKLDRDDMVDITDLDVVAWLKAEMRVMLDEELARAILIGDGREPDDEDKIDEDHLRPIAYDDAMYAHPVTLPAEVKPEDIIESVIRARVHYKGTGTPTFYTTDAILTDLLLLKDKVDRRLYETEESLAAQLRVAKIVPVEVMESTPDIVGIVVNIADYRLGADKGGQISMFDDFDIDYNQHKYLIETRLSGALTKPKSAVVIKRTPGNQVIPKSPSFDSAKNTITFPVVEGVIYTVNGTPRTGTLVISETTDVESSPAPGYSFPHNINTDWVFTYTAG